MLPPSNVLDLKSHSFIKASLELMRLWGYNETTAEANLLSSWRTLTSWITALICY